MTPGIMINVDVGDLDRAAAFYMVLLDLQIGRRLGEAVLELVGGAVPIYLLLNEAGTVAGPATTDRRRYDRHWTPVHLDFVVDDVDKKVTAALAAGATLDDPTETHDWGRIAHLADPFGNGFCLVQFLGRGYDEVAT
jgi:predicted enzyme related to lactoylglutathione lyase